jgi:hypothetical protein
MLIRLQLGWGMRRSYALAIEGYLDYCLGNGLQVGADYGISGREGVRCPLLGHTAGDSVTQAKLIRGAR